MICFGAGHTLLSLHLRLPCFPGLMRVLLRRKSSLRSGLRSRNVRSRANLPPGLHDFLRRDAVYILYGIPIGVDCGGFYHLPPSVVGSLYLGCVQLLRGQLSNCCAHVHERVGCAGLSAWASLSESRFRLLAPCFQLIFVQLLRG